MVLKNVIRTYWGMQKSKMQNHIMCPLRGLVQHRPKNPPNLGRMGCLCQLLSPKGHMIWFLFFQYTFPVAKWVRKYPPCALHKTFLVRCLRKYSASSFQSKKNLNNSTSLNRCYCRVGALRAPSGLHKIIKTMSDLDKTGGIPKSCLRSLNQDYVAIFNS